MDIKILPGVPLRGGLDAPISKSAAHRALLCAALACGESRVSPVGMSSDAAATISAVTALGAEIHADGDALTVRGVGTPSAQAIIDCGESGSTLRFIVPIAAALGVKTTFLGRGRLPLRPMTPLADALSAHGVSCTMHPAASIPAGQAMPILTTSGQLSGGVFCIAGDVSSQYVTGLLLALPLLKRDSEIRLTSPLQSCGYVDMTIEAMSRAGVAVQPTQTGWIVPGGQKYQPCEAEIEGDYSGAAFWLCAGAVQPGAEITVRGLLAHSLQGDRAVVEILQSMGAEIVRHGDSVTVRHRPLKAVDIDAGDIPDLIPVLAVTAAVAAGTTRICNAGRLRLKESDRLAAISAGLIGLGANVVEGADSLVITGKPELRGGIVSSFADHRIAMAMAVASLRCREPVIVTGAQCTQKSYPDFWDELRRLGGDLRELEMGQAV